MAWLTGAFNWVANSKAAQIVILIVGAILALKTVQMKARMDGEAAQRKRQQLEQANTRGAIIERADSIIKEERNNADDALRARDHGEPVAAYDELPDEHRRIAEGRT